MGLLHYVLVRQYIVRDGSMNARQARFYDQVEHDCAFLGASAAFSRPQIDDDDVSRVVQHPPVTTDRQTVEKP